MDAVSDSALRKRRVDSRAEDHIAIAETTDRRSDQSAAEDSDLTGRFHSILFESADDGPKHEAAEAPAFFADLNLDQIVDAIVANKEEYNLRPFFHEPLHDRDAIQYRHEVMRDLENPALLGYVASLRICMRSRAGFTTADSTMPFSSAPKGGLTDNEHLS